MMASETRTMAAWALTAMLLCASIAVGDPVKQRLIQYYKNLFKPARPSTCDTECKECGTNTDPSEYTIFLQDKLKLSSCGFATIIGKRLALTIRYSYWIRLFTAKSFNVFLWTNKKFTHDPEYDIIKLEKSMKDTNAAIIVLVFNKDFPSGTPCLPTSPLLTEIGMKFEVSMFKMGQGYPRLPVNLLIKELSISDIPDAKGRLLTLDYDESTEARHALNRQPDIVNTFGGLALHKVNDRYIVSGFLLWMSESEKDSLHIEPIYEPSIVPWIHKVAGKNRACDQPKPEDTPTPSNHKHSP